jgi:hypothetical protein
VDGGDHTGPEGQGFLLMTSGSGKSHVGSLHDPDLHSEGLPISPNPAEDAVGYGQQPVSRQEAAFQGPQRTDMASPLWTVTDFGLQELPKQAFGLFTEEKKILLEVGAAVILEIGSPEFLRLRTRARYAPYGIGFHPIPSLQAGSRIRPRPPEKVKGGRP